MSIYRIISTTVRSAAVKTISNLPVDGSMEVIIRKHTRARSLSQNALMWGVRLKEIAEQAWVEGRQFSPEVWHEFLKRKYLPEGNEDELASIVKSPETYRKWDMLPSGDLMVIGSTTQLTVYGMNQYMEQCTAYAAWELGVMFSVGV